MAVAVAGAVALRLREQLEQTGDARMGRDELGLAALEEGAPLGRNRVGILEVLVEQRARVAGVQAVNVVRAHPCVVPGEVWLSSR